MQSIEIIAIEIPDEMLDINIHSSLNYEITVERTKEWKKLQYYLLEKQWINVYLLVNCFNYVCRILVSYLFYTLQKKILQLDATF